MRTVSKQAIQNSDGTNDVVCNQSNGHFSKFVSEAILLLPIRQWLNKIKYNNSTQVTKGS